MESRVCVQRQLGQTLWLGLGFTLGGMDNNQTIDEHVWREWIYLEDMPIKAVGRVISDSLTPGLGGVDFFI